MSRGEELASRFREAYLPVVTFIESVDNKAWSTFVPDEQATVAAVMNHVAQSMRYNGSVLKAFRLGNPPIQLTQEMIDGYNQAEKAEASEPSRSEVLEAMRAALTGSPHPSRRRPTRHSRHRQRSRSATTWRRTWSSGLSKSRLRMVLITWGPVGLRWASARYAQGEFRHPRLPVSQGKEDKLAPSAPMQEVIREALVVRQDAHGVARMPPHGGIGKSQDGLRVRQAPEV